MGKVIAITNQKGGVGKTTTAFNLGVGLKNCGYRVLFIDLDPQCNLTYYLGGDYEAPGSLEIFRGNINAEQFIQHCGEGDLIAGNMALCNMETELKGINAADILKNGIKDVIRLYDYVILDGPPSLGILTVNMLMASDYIVIPALADVLSLMGVGQLYSTIEGVKNHGNPNLKIAGILLTKYAERLTLNRDMKEMTRDTAEQLGTIVFETAIRDAVKIRESTASQMSIFKYAPNSKQALDYGCFVHEFLKAVEY